MIPAWVDDVVSSARSAGEDIPASVGLAGAYGERFPLPGGGATATRWGILSAVARVNLTTARVIEAHTDALAVLAEAGLDVPSGRTWGVFAAEAADTRLDAEPDGRHGVVLSGTKPWCSLAGQLDAALVTAHGEHGRQLFRVELKHAGVDVEDPQGWVARGLRTVTSGPVHFSGVPASPVGGPGWYLTRPGFAWGGIGVAACWHGGALGLHDALLRTARAKTSGRELMGLHVGTVDAALHASGAALEHAARIVDEHPGDEDPALLAHRTRAVVAEAVERTLHQVGHALGPAPLAFDADHAARVADLMLYVRQHHGERDLAALGSMAIGQTG